MKDKDCKQTPGRYNTAKEFMAASGISEDIQSQVENTTFCNQCGQHILKDDAGMAFCCPPAGPVYVCIECSPPANAETVIRDISDFMGMASESQSGQ